jgi:hypothetical protein
MVELLDVQSCVMLESNDSICNLIIKLEMLSFDSSMTITPLISNNLTI